MQSPRDQSPPREARSTSCASSAFAAPQGEALLLAICTATSILMLALGLFCAA